MLKNYESYSPLKSKSAFLLLENGDIFWGQGIGAKKYSVGELCFNTSQTGYQEILTDPSYARQIITFTFPHIGIVGTNNIDIESDKIVNSAGSLELNSSTPGLNIKDPDGTTRVTIKSGSFLTIGAGTQHIEKMMDYL